MNSSIEGICRHISTLWVFDTQVQEQMSFRCPSHQHHRYLLIMFFWFRVFRPPQSSVLSGCGSPSHHVTRSLSIDVNNETHGVEYYGDSSSMTLIKRLYKRCMTTSYFTKDISRLSVKPKSRLWLVISKTSFSDLFAEDFTTIYPRNTSMSLYCFSRLINGSLDSALL